MNVAPSAFSTRLTRLLCLIVLAAMTIAAAYAVWIGVSNFSRIRV